MVVKRTCSFCAGEIEPGTGSMYVKRDGTVFHFCSSSCRKQQLHLGRVGHRLKWTRAHAIKKAAEQANPKGARTGGDRRPVKAPAAPKAPEAPAPAATPAPSAAAPKPAAKAKKSAATPKPPA
jgi:large subunit ribosomal protein L24e